MCAFVWQSFVCVPAMGAHRQLDRTKDLLKTAWIGTSAVLKRLKSMHVSCIKAGAALCSVCLGRPDCPAHLAVTSEPTELLAVSTTVRHLQTAGTRFQFWAVLGLLVATTALGAHDSSRPAKLRCQTLKLQVLGCQFKGKPPDERSSSGIFKHVICELGCAVQASAHKAFVKKALLCRFAAGNNDGKHGGSRKAEAAFANSATGNSMHCACFHQLPCPWSNALTQIRKLKYTLIDRHHETLSTWGAHQWRIENVNHSFVTSRDAKFIEQCAS